MRLVIPTLPEAWSCCAVLWLDRAVFTGGLAFCGWAILSGLGAGPLYLAALGAGLAPAFVIALRRT